MPLFLWRRKAGEAVGQRGKRSAGSCDSCVNYVFDEECQYYVCEAHLDEDDMVRFLSSESFHCPYYRLDDEYQVVRHQM
ncbi:MAG: hypothetical protein HFG70_02575 [Hungatella sp.]|nr:hypothetical protein [Hungatella sp.]